MGLCVVMRLLDASTELMNAARSANPQLERWEWNCLSAWPIIHATSWSFSLSLAASKRGRFITPINSSLSAQQMIAENQSKEGPGINTGLFPQTISFLLVKPLYDAACQNRTSFTRQRHNSSVVVKVPNFLVLAFFPSEKLPKFLFSERL